MRRLTNRYLCIALVVISVTIFVLNGLYPREVPIYLTGTASHCIIPSIQPDTSWIPKNFQPISCPVKTPNPAYTLNGSVFIDNGLECNYAELFAQDDFTSIFDRKTILIKTGWSPCPSDSFFLNCQDKDSKKTVFNNPMRCIFRKHEINQKISKAVKEKAGPFEEKLNILMLGLDSLSRVAWLEQMPKTTEVMTKTFGGLIFEGYNIVGDGTTAAILGITTGFLEEELHESRRGFRGAKTVDDFPFIWRQLSEEANYVTLWDEDDPSTGTFHYRLLGFQKPPVDYYGRPYHIALENFAPKHNCLGSETVYHDMLKQFRELFTVYPDPIRKFAISFSSQYTHTSHYSNYQEAYKLDALIAEELESLNNKGYLNESVVILFADHGSRFGGDRSTERGKISERLPFLAIALPAWFRQKYKAEMRNFEKSSKLLTTPFDLHATLLDIGGVEAKLGLPLRESFFSALSPNRTCDEVGISPHWCTCMSSDSSKLPLDHPLVQRCLNTFEHHVNNNLLGSLIKSGQCRRLNVLKATSVERLALRKEVAQFVKTVDGHGRSPGFDKWSPIKEEYIQLMFQTTPGNGSFEVTFRHSVDSDEITVQEKQISRTNMYGTAPHCIQDSFPHLREFCFCTEQLQN